MSHTFHPDTLDAGLCDDCPDCQVKAIDPIGRLDQTHMRDVWLRMVAVEHPSSRDSLPQPYSETRRYRTDLEATVCRTLYRMAVFIERYGDDLDPWTWPVQASTPFVR